MKNMQSKTKPINLKQCVVLGVKIIRKILDQKKYSEKNLTVLFVGQINQN